MQTITIPQLFEAVQVVVFNLSKNKARQNRMAMYGITPKRVQEGAALLENARALYNIQEGHYDQARELTLQGTKDNLAAYEVFKDHVAIAKSAYRKEPLVIKKLKITRIAGSKWGWTEQALQFYSKAPQFMEKLQQYGATEAGFQQNKAAVEALFALQALRLGKKADAEGSTVERNESIKALRAWYGEFRKLARIAFKDNPRILKTFGIVKAPSRKKSKEIPEKAEADSPTQDVG